MKQRCTRRVPIYKVLYSRLLPGLILVVFAAIGTALFVQSRAETPNVVVSTGTRTETRKGPASSAAKPGSPAATPPAAKPPTPPPAATSKPAAPTPEPVPRPVAPAQVPPPVAATGTSRKVKITLYGAYDNDPAGSRAIAHPVIHQLAGGTGSYADPLTFASPSGAGEYPWGQIIYVPAMQKYFIREDSCGVSWTAPNGCGGVDMVDLYIGNPSDSQNVTACEEALTPDGNAEIIMNPAANLVYDAAPLWNQATGTCARLH